MHLARIQQPCRHCRCPSAEDDVSDNRFPHLGVRLRWDANVFYPRATPLAPTPQPHTMPNAMPSGHAHHPSLCPSSPLSSPQLRTARDTGMLTSESGVRVRASALASSPRQAAGLVTAAAGSGMPSAAQQRGVSWCKDRRSKETGRQGGWGVAAQWCSVPRKNGFTCFPSGRGQQL